jgi:hypothetical protein
MRDRHFAASLPNRKLMAGMALHCCSPRCISRPLQLMSECREDILVSQALAIWRRGKNNNADQKVFRPAMHNHSRLWRGLRAQRNCARTICNPNPRTCRLLLVYCG